MNHTIDKLRTKRHDHKGNHLFVGRCKNQLETDLLLSKKCSTSQRLINLKKNLATKTVQAMTSKIM